MHYSTIPVGIQSFISVTNLERNLQILLINPGIIFVIAVPPPPPKHGPFILLCPVHMSPHSLACQSRNNFRDCCPPPPPNMALYSIVSSTYEPPAHTWPVNPHNCNTVINTYTKRFLLIHDLRILKLSDSLETHFFSINALFRSLTKASTFGFSSNELVEE